MSAFVAQFALLDVFYSPAKHFGRLKWLTYGGSESDPVEIPADERQLVLANLFTAVYYATQRARVLCGRPFADDNNQPNFKCKTFSFISILLYFFQMFSLEPYLPASTAY